MQREARCETPEKAFLAKVSPVPVTGCWLWTGALNRGGYGVLKNGDRNVLAHRYSCERTRGRIPANLELDHLCRVRSCVNPDHLEAVTRKVNTHRGFGPSGINARATHCIHGHPFAGDNLYRRPNGKRECRECAGRPLPPVVKTCKRGHRLTDPNLYYRPSGKRECAACRKLRR